MGGIPVNPFDLIFGFILVFFCIRGLYHGMVREVATIIGIIAGFFLANHFYTIAAPFAERFISSPEIAQLTAYIVVLFATFLGVVLVLNLFRNLLQLSLLGGVDRFAGAFVGFIKAYVICALLLVVLTTFLSSGNDHLAESKLAPFIDNLSSSFSAMLPDSLRADFAQKGQALQEFWNTDWAEAIRKKQ
ncbi:MAG: CvpA family protein [Desulfovibrionales bacterium]